MINPASWLDRKLEFDVSCPRFIKRDEACFECFEIILGTLVALLIAH